MNQTEEIQRLANVLTTLAATISEIMINRLPPVHVQHAQATKAVMPGENERGLPRLAFTMKETAKIMGVSYITVHRLIQTGLLKSSNAVRHKIIPRTEIERFLKMTLE